MKRYILFGFDDYYPSGGWSDFLYAGDSIEECKEHTLKLKWNAKNNYQIVDTIIGEIVYEN